jgi:hypothetical protein
MIYNKERKIKINKAFEAFAKLEKRLGTWELGAGA